MIWIILTIILALVCALLMQKLLFLKREMKNAKEELKLTREKTYNRQLTVSLIDKDMSALMAEINQNLDYQKKLKLEAEKSRQELKNSVSDIAHDLRTPLTVIKGNIQMLYQGDSISEQGQVYLDICRNKTDELKEMVDEFFELSVLESDDSKVSVEPVNIINTIMQFILENEAVIRGAVLEPEIVLPPQSIMIMANEKMLCRILSNLLNNTLKYAYKKFSVIVREQRHDICEIEFSNELDSGIMLDTEHIFDRSYRGEESRRKTGTGLGLYIVKLLAQKQGADVLASVKDNVLKIVLLFPAAPSKEKRKI